MPEELPSGLWHLKDGEVLEAENFKINGPKVLRVQKIDAVEGNFLLVQVGDKKIQLPGHDLTIHVHSSLPTTDKSE